MVTVTPALRSNENTMRTCSMCSSAVCQEMMMSSKYTKANCYLTRDKITSMVCWNVLGALQNPNSYRRIGVVCDVRWTQLCCHQLPSSLLAKAAITLQSWECKCISERVNTQVHSRYRVGVASFHCIQHSIVYRKSKWSIFLSVQTEMERPIPFWPVQLPSFPTFCQLLNFSKLLHFRLCSIWGTVHCFFWS